MMENLTFLLFVFSILVCVSCDTHALLKSTHPSDGVSWLNPDTYYFHNIHDKMKASVSSNCTTHYKVIESSTSFSNKSLIVPDSEEKFHVILSPIDPAIYRWWKHIPKPQQMRVDPNLCEVISTKKRPIFDNPGCQLPHYMAVSAPRCQTSYLKWICKQSQLPINRTTPNHFVIPESDHSTWVDPPTPYIIVTKNAFSTMCGQLKTICGIVHPNTNCMSPGQSAFSQSFAKKCSFDLLPSPQQQQSRPSSVQCLAGTPFSNEVTLHEKVFVVAQVDDTYIYHIHVEIFPRLVYYLDYLQQHRDIKILIACDSKNKKSVTLAGIEEGMRSVYLLANFFGIAKTRFLVHQHIHAQELYLPMEGACQDPVFNTWHLLHMRSIVFKKLHLHEESQRHTNRIMQPPPIPGNSGDNQQSAYRPVIVVLKRSATSMHTRNKFDLVRQWSEGFTQELITSLQTRFPTFQILLYSDQNQTLMTCFACQVNLLAKADVLIGVHGAALSMMLYMPPNSAVIEIAPYGNDGRCLLGGGPFSRMAAVLSHNYMIHHPLYDEFTWKNDRTSTFNLTRFVLHTHSFLHSIGFVKS